MGQGMGQGKGTQSQDGCKNLGQPEFTDETKLRESSKQGGSEFSEA